MNHLVMLTENYDGVIDNPRWCAAATFDTNRTICGEVMDEGSHYVAVVKEVERGGITCQICERIVRDIKKIKL